MTDTPDTPTVEPSAEDIMRFNRAVAELADRENISLDEAGTNFGNLLANLDRDPTGTALLFTDERVDELVTKADNLEDRVTRLEEQIAPLVE